MGLRDLFRGVRKKDEGQKRPGNAPPTTTLSATTSTTLNAVQSVSQPTTQTTSNTTLSTSPSYVKRDLWDEAYEALRAENEDLIQKYEAIILEHDKRNNNATGQQLGVFKAIPIPSFQSLIRVLSSPAQIVQAGRTVTTNSEPKDQRGRPRKMANQSGQSFARPS